MNFNIEHNTIQFQQFVEKYFNLNQTAFIEDLLANDHIYDLRDYIKNHNWYKVNLSINPNFKGTDIAYNKQMEFFRKKLQEQNGKVEIQTIRKDIQSLENAYIGERVIFEWYAIPYWIARWFIQEGEVVLFTPMAYWWGKTTIDIIMEKALLLKLFKVHEKLIN